MRAISRARWDALASYSRKPLAVVLMQELAWFEAGNESVLATLIVDTDGEYSGILLARDLVGRFRWVGSTGLFDTPEGAVVDLYREVSELLSNLDERRAQGDEPGKAVDFFTPLVAEEKLHLRFRRLASGDGFSAAREIIGAMMRWHEDVDGNFVEQFQTTGFDARLWELYLFAALTEANLEVTHPKPAPDFLVQGLGGEFTLEATTINPSANVDGQPVVPPSLETEEERKLYTRHYLPIRYAGPLTTKLKKEYWKKPAAVGKPLVFAIQDFHAPMSMVYSGRALPIYLYGYVHVARRDGDGKLIIESSRITDHRWGSKVVKSGFFSLPGAENVSAVMFNSGGTLTKFNRMGVSAGFGADNVVLIRRGAAWDPDANASEPMHFMHFVTEGYPETWMEGMDVFHNPHALIPLDPDLLPGAAHHRLLEDGRVETVATGFKPMDSPTSILTFGSQEEEETVQKTAD